MIFYVQSNHISEELWGFKVVEEEDNLILK
jgi:hypothetical protein